MSSSTSSNTSTATESVPISMMTKYLPDDFVPSSNEVMIGRGRKIVQHSGNVKLRGLVQLKAKDYSETSDKTHKSFIISEIGNTIRRESEHGGFVKKDPTTGKWYVVSDSCIRATVAQAFRDHLSPNYRSSKYAKQRRRWCAKTASSSSSGGSNTSTVPATTCPVLNQDNTTTSGSGAPLPAVTPTKTTADSITMDLLLSSSYRPMASFNLQKAVTSLSFPCTPASSALTSMVASNQNSNTTAASLQTTTTPLSHSCQMNQPMASISSLELPTFSGLSSSSPKSTSTSTSNSFAAITSILQRSLDILDDDDLQLNDEEDWISYSNNPFEPNPIAETTPEAATLSLGAVNEDWWF